MRLSSATPRRRPRCRPTPRLLQRLTTRRASVRGAMATSGPLEIAELGERLKMTPATLEKHLLTLEAKGLVFRGHFIARRSMLGATRARTASAGEQWCDRYKLEKI